MTSSNENDSTPVVPAATPSHTDTGSSHAEGSQGEGGERPTRDDRGPRHPRRAGTGLSLIHI